MRIGEQGAPVDPVDGGAGEGEQEEVDDDAHDAVGARG